MLAPEMSKRRFKRFVIGACVVSAGFASGWLAFNLALDALLGGRLFH